MASGDIYCALAKEMAPSKCRYNIKISRETFGDFGKERGFLAGTLALASLRLV